MWAVEQYPGVAPDMTVFGKSIGGGLPLAGVTGGAEVMDAVPPGGLGGTFGGNPLSCAAALAVLDIASEPEFLAGARQLGETLRARLEYIAARNADIGEVRGLGSMLAFEFAERSPDRAKAVVDAAFERGLLLLSCGLYGNVIRLLPPLNIAPDELDEGLAILEDSLGA
jgi:4-aminobutyrate aminotransferase/(S)-3-amino-2-methylpropionate transaminase